MKRPHFISATPPDWKMWTRIVLSVLTFGWGWLSGNQDIVLAFVASLIVWVLGLLAERKWEVGKAVKTVALFVVAIILELGFAPVHLPTFPGFEDVAALTAFLGAFFEIAKTVLAAATVIYNLLLSKILEAGGHWLRARKLI